MTLSVHLTTLGSAQRTLLRDLHFEVPPGRILTLMGPSGSGKSSVLAAIAGTLGSVAEGAQALRFEGQIHLDGTDLTHTPTAQRGIGLLFQDDLLFAHMTVAENLLFAVPAGPKRDRLDAVERALSEAGLAGFGARDFHLHLGPVGGTRRAGDGGAAGGQVLELLDRAARHAERHPAEHLGG